MASSRRTGTNEAIFTYGAGKDYQSVQTWSNLTAINMTTGVGIANIINLSGYFTAGETITWSGGSGVFIGWKAGFSLSSATIYLKSPSGSPSGTITGSTSGKTATIDSYSTGGCSPVLECYAGTYDDPFYMYVDSGYTNADYFRIVRPAAGERGDGTCTTGVRFVCDSIASSNAAIEQYEKYSQIQDVSIKLTISSSSTRYGIQVAEASAALVGVVVYDCTNSGAGYAHGFQINAGDAVLVNCIAQGNENRGFNFTSPGSHVYNCTAAGNGYGFYNVNGADITLINCLGVDNTTWDFLNDFGSGTRIATNCACSDTSFSTVEEDESRNFVTTNCLESVSVTFANAAGDDYHLAATDTDVIGFGADLSADGTYAFDDDIDALTRSGWDIGADNKYADSGEPDAENVSSIVDVIRLTQILASAITDRAGVVDLIKVQQEISRVLTDRSAISDIVGFRQELIHAISDAAGVVDSVVIDLVIAGGVLYEEAVTEAQALVDVAVMMQDLNAARIDVAGIVDRIALSQVINVDVFWEGPDS